jgi:protein-disulfide isomerase
MRWEEHASSHPSSSSPVTTGFLWGLVGGLALSLGVVGMAAGYSLGRMSPGGGGDTQIVQAPTPTPSAPTPEAPSGPVPPVSKDDHVRGNPKAKVTIIEYSDFECPFCKRHHPTMKAVAAKYGNDVNWVYRHFPLSFHQNAQKEAEASECVADLGGNDAFWKFTDAIYERTAAGGTGIALDQLGPIAKEMGVDQAKFQSCLDSGKFAKKVQDQMNAGSAAGVNGTPGSFIINNDTKASQMISGAVPQASFDSAIDAILKK